MAGLGWAVKLRSNTPFLGREALLRAAGATVAAAAGGLSGRRSRRRPARPRDDLPRRPPLGWLTSGGFGYTLGKPIGYGYVRDPAASMPAYVMGGSYELEVAGERVPALPFLRPPYDPEMRRIRA